MDPEAEKQYSERPSAVPDGWQGTKPAEGTRRKLILDTLIRTALSVKPSHSTALRFADAVEGELLRLEAMTTPASTSDDLRACNQVLLGRLSASRELVSRRERTIDRLQSVLRDRDGELAEARDALDPALRGLIHRTDRWVSEVVYQAAGAATRPLLEDHPDYVFPSERVSDAVAELLSDFGIPRAHRDCVAEEIKAGLSTVNAELDEEGHVVKSEPSESGGLSLAGEEVDKALNHLILARRETVEPAELERINHAITATHMVIEPPSEDRGDDAPTEESYEDRLLREREEARAGESRFAEERDCAFALLRWLLPVTVAKRLDGGGD